MHLYIAYSESHAENGKLSGATKNCHVLSELPVQQSLLTVFWSGSDSNVSFVTFLCQVTRSSALILTLILRHLNTRITNDKSHHEHIRRVQYFLKVTFCQASQGLAWLVTTSLQEFISAHK